MPRVSTSRVNTPSPASLATKGCSCSAGPAQPRHAHLRHAKLDIKASRMHRKGLRSAACTAQACTAKACATEASSCQSQVSPARSADSVIPDHSLWPMAQALVAHVYTILCCHSRSTVG